MLVRCAQVDHPAPLLPTMKVRLGMRQCQRIFDHMGFRLRRSRPQVAQSDPVKVATFQNIALPGTMPER